MLSIKQRYKFVKDRIKKDTYELDEEGREIIDISITDPDSLLSVYNPDGKPVIDNNMAEVIDNAIKSTSFKKDIHLKIACEKYTKDKEPTYKDAITNYYINEFADKEQKIHNNTLITLTLLILAIISFAVLLIIQEFNLPWIIREFANIVAWVFSWEVIDMIFFQRQIIKFEQRQDIKKIFAKITFTTLKSNKKSN